MRDQALDMYLNNVGLRKIARFTGVSPAGVPKWIRKVQKALDEQLARALRQVGEQVPDIIESANSSIRDNFARFNRRSKRHSKSWNMLAITLDLFFNRHLLPISWW